MSDARNIVKMQGITKHFGFTVANSEVDFDLRSREIHVLLGENGAGKTTLMNILFGHIRQDRGSIQLDGNEVKIDSPLHAIQHGIGMVHQHFTLVPSFTVAENVMLGVRKATNVSFRAGDIEKEVNRKAEELHMPIDAATEVRSLPTDLQQRVEILKALYRGAQILIMDEPTSLLGPKQIENLLMILSNLRDSGHSIILVTHKLAEVVEIADRVTVLRKGTRVTSMDRGSFDEKSLAHAMTGQERIQLPERRKNNNKNEVLALEVRNLLVHSTIGDFNSVDDLSFHVAPGEILGIAGVEGNGQREIVDCLFGLKTPDQGNILIEERDVTESAPIVRRKAGLGAIPEDRQGLGLVLDMTIGENIAMSKIISGKYSRIGLIKWGQVASDSVELLKEYDVRPPDPSVKTSSLSGGNQQKIVLAREMSTHPSILVADNPTWGLDVGAIDYVHQRILELRDKGGAVLLLTLDLEELFKLSDRVLVLYRGRKTLEGLAAEVKGEKLALAMAGGSK
ncbi:MAG: heme ABC transporter ATP-binding protein [Acidiferrobacteraceae bacterium]|nr:heme ABC transporter ATP-binding protein [Acidiferrobacteraceae bacterium]|tara:strand:+ start:30484 stop:32010 length:1527 start_codon:yes stop_codon:yes gene_type:complete